jgi:hypothetical protein
MDPVILVIHKIEMLTSSLMIPLIRRPGKKEEKIL